MKVRKVRKCYALDWSVECEVNGVVWDVECATQDHADRLYNFLKALRHAQKAGL